MRPKLIPSTTTRVAQAALLALVGLGVASCGPSPSTVGETGASTSSEVSLSIAPDIEARLARFAPTPLEADLSALSEEDRQVLDKLIEAGRIMDQIYLQQAWAGNPELAAELEAYDGPNAEAARTYFRLNVGPWDRLDEREPFIGDKAHPDGAGFYPEDLSTEELDAWLEAHPDQAEAFRSTVTVIRRDGENLVTVPYALEYREFLEPAAALLREAAALTSNASLKTFLELRADAFGSDDYYASDMAWMDLDAPVEVTIGPYEVYEDELFNYKASFEAFVTVALPEQSAALEAFKGELPWLERNLPIPDSYKNFDRGTDSPIRVVDEVFTGGDTKAGVQTIAFNLPNDERVREAKGSKKVLLRNIMRAKYDQILVPIAERVLAAGDLERVSFEAYFSEVLHHELSHGLGPGRLVIDGRETEVRLELGPNYSTMEEAKADVMGVYNILALIDKGLIPASLRQDLEPTYVAGLFRSARFGVHEAHGRGVVAQFNYLREQGALVVDGDGRYRIVAEKFPAGIEKLLSELLLLQGNGDAEGTDAFLERYGHPDEDLLAAIGRLEDLPVDVRPIYSYAESR